MVKPLTNLMDISYRIHGEDIAGLSLSGGGRDGRENSERNLAYKVDGIRPMEELEGQGV